jgi:hypothetical protein
MITVEFIIFKDRSECWYQNNKLHRDNDQPSVVYPDGSKLWYQNGMRHRDGDLPAVIHTNGAKYWCKNNRFIKSEIPK